MSNPVIDKIDADLAMTADLLGFNRADVLDEWYSTLSAAIEDGDGGLPPIDSTTLYLDSLGEPHWTASQRDIDVWQENKDTWTQEALDYVKELQNGN